MTQYVEETVFEAPRDIVYEVFADRERSGEYLPFTTELTREGHTERQGVGAVHRIGVGPVAVHEEIIDLVTDERIQYRVVRGLPVRTHVGTITFADHPSGTTVRYSMESTPLIPFPDSLMRLILRRSMTTIVEGARAESAKRAAASGETTG